MHFPSKILSSTLSKPFSFFFLKWIFPPWIPSEHTFPSHIFSPSLFIPPFHFLPLSASHIYQLRFSGLFWRGTRVLRCFILTFFFSVIRSFGVFCPALPVYTHMSERDHLLFCNLLFQRTSSVYPVMHLKVMSQGVEEVLYLKSAIQWPYY